MMRTILTAICLVCFASMAYAAPSVTVPGGYATISAAVAAVDDGGTVTITDSGIYAEPYLLIAKPVKLFAAAGQTPVIKNDGTTNATFLKFTQEGDVEVGSLDGGRIQFTFVRGVAGTQPATQWVELNQTTGSLVKFENVDILCTGSTATANIQSIVQNQTNGTAKKAPVTFRYCSLDWGRQATYLSGSQYGMVIGSTAYIATTPQGGSTWTIDHVKIKGYNRSGVWQQTRDAEVNMSYCEIGVFGERFGTATGNPWGGIVNNQAAARWVGRIDHSVFNGPATYSGCNISAPGSSVTLTRNVFLCGYNIGATGSVGALQVSGAASTATYNGVLSITADHCDFVDLSVAGSNAAAIYRNASENTTCSLVITNSNIYSQSNKAVNLRTFRDGIDSFASSNNNVYGAVDSAGYSMGTGDIAFNPMYFSAASADVRYSNNTLKTAASDGGPVGVNASYADIYNIVAGEEGVINRAHGWTTLK